MISCEFCEISKKTFFTEHLWTTASGLDWLLIELNKGSKTEKKIRENEEIKKKFRNTGRINFVLI